MDVNALYNIAKGFVTKMQNEKPALAAEPDAAICLILTNDDEVYSGVTAMGIHNGNIVAYPAECVALIAMFAAGKFKAKQMLILSMNDLSILVPCIEAVDMLMLLDTGNDECEAAISEERFVTVRQLMQDDVIEEEETEDMDSAEVNFFSGFGDDEEDGEAAAVFEGGFDESYSAPQHAPVQNETSGNVQLGAPVEFASGVDVDESNPFYEPPGAGEGDSEAAASETKVNKHMETETAPAQTKSMSKAELLKQAKKRKKVAKSNFNFFKKKQQ